MAIRLIAAIALPRLLRVDTSVLGQVVPTTMGTRPVDVHFPVVDWGRFGMPHLAAPPALALLSPPPDWDKLDQPATWGEPLRFDLEPRHVYEAELHRIGLEVTVTPDDKIEAPANRNLEITPVEEWLRATYDTWAIRVSDWVEVLTRQIGAPEARAHQAPRAGDGLHVWIGEGTEWTDPRKTLAVTVRTSMSDPVWGTPAHLETITDVLHNVAQGETPNPEHLYLRDARAALLAGQTRRAVLDAGLAAELVLLPAYLEALGPPPRKAGKEPQDPPLGILVRDLYKAGVLRDDLTDRLVKTRNDATHRGATISETDAAAAVREAEGLFEQFGVIPSRTDASPNGAG